MRLIRKSCPNCGAGLKFNKNDTEVTCEYCKQSFMIEDREIGERIQIDPSMVRDVSEVAKTGAAVVGTVSIISTVIFVIAFLLIVGTMIFGMIMVRNHFFPKEEVVEKDNSFNLDYMPSADYITDFSQLTDETLITMTKESLNQLESCSFVKGYEGGDWSFVGRYLLTTKTERLLNVNLIYEVYKREYTKDDGSKRVVYATVIFNDIIKLHGEIIVPTHSVLTRCPPIPDAGTINFLNGYNSLEDLYNATIKEWASTYNVKATDGMYLG